jgi:ATP-dependent RNA helicase DHX37/DHR1
VFENYFDQFSEPEILRVPIEGVVLQMKSMHIDAVFNFPFPTPPDRPSLLQAERILTRLGALQPPQGSVKEVTGGQITDLGRTMSLFPLSPRFSRMIVSGRQHGCLPYIIAIVATLSVGDPFVREEAVGNESDNDDEEGDDDDDDGDLVHLTSEKGKAKERRKLRRKGFFQSQQVSLRLAVIYSLPNFRLRFMRHWAGGPATFFAPCQLSAHTSMQEAECNSAQSTSYAQKQVFSPFLILKRLF